MNQAALDFFATPGKHTTLADAEVPASTDITDVVAFVQGLLVYDTVAEAFYGAELTADQGDAIHLRDSQDLLDAIRRVDGRPLNEARLPGSRAGARCHAFSRLTVAVLRANGVPARARCGFGAYFLDGWFEDHWVAEYWSPGARRWVMADAQLDDRWCELLAFDGDPLDLSDDQFVTAGHAWRAWRSGTADAGRYGLSAIDEHGAHWIGHNLRLDLASLNKVEMLPWDIWGAGWEPGDTPDDATLDLFDEVAALTVEPDADFAALRDLYDADERLRMGGTVFSVAKGLTETI